MSKTKFSVSIDGREVSRHVSFKGAKSALEFVPGNKKVTICALTVEGKPGATVPIAWKRSGNDLVETNHAKVPHTIHFSSTKKPASDPKPKKKPAAKKPKKK